MKRNNFSFMLLAIITLSLLAAFFLVTPVFAQDETPPEVAPVEEPVVEELAPLLETLSEADVEVVDATGEILLLAVEVPSDVDPWFKVGSTTYSFTTLDCDPDPLVTTPCAQPLQAAVDYISARGKVPSDGFIHVEAGAIPNQKVIVDGTLPYLNSIKGIIGQVNPETLLPDSLLSFTDGISGSYLFIKNKLNGFNITGLTILGDVSTTPEFGVVDIINSSGALLLQNLAIINGYPNGSGIRISAHYGSITLKNVDSRWNQGGGAYVETLGTFGVTIINSGFDDNHGIPLAYPTTGVHILTHGPVSINGISASRNDGTDPSLWIQNASSVTIKGGLLNNNFNASLGVNIDGMTGAVTLQDVYADHNRNGINVLTKGNITLINVSGSGNNNDGANLDTCGGIYPCTNTTGTGKVTINGGIFNNNLGNNGGTQYGLGVLARGAITLTNVNASNNGTVGINTYGASLFTSWGNLASPVSVSSSMFNSNICSVANLLISAKGSINLTGVTSGLNTHGPGAVLNGQAKVTIKGTLSGANFFYGNTGDGLNIDTSGNVSLTYVYSTNNTEDGIQIDTLGTVSLNNSQANSNPGYGFYFQNTSTANNLSISNSDFYYNGNGIYVSSIGTITLSNVDVFGSTYGGAGLDNMLAMVPRNVTIKNGSFSYNANGAGLSVITKGVINISNITAQENAGWGVYLDQTPSSFGSTPTFPVTTISNGYISDNGNNGLTLLGRGTVKLTNVLSNNNDGFGAYIENYSGNVSVLASGTSGGNDFSYNTGSHGGLAINSPGAIVLNKVTARGNSGATGAFLYHFDGGAGPTGNVTINGGDYSYQDSGIVVYSKGSINVNNITANGNIIGGITLRNTSDTTGTKNVIVTRSTANSNGDIGLAIRSYGTITLNQITAVDNTSVGVSLDNTFGAFTTPKGISVLGSYGTNNINENGMTGLDIRTKGIVVISKLNANENKGDGIVIDNYQGGLGKGTISLSYVTANSNLIDGIDIWTNNAVTLSSVKVFFNGFPTGGYGIDIINAYNHSIKVTNSLISGNAGSGIYALIGSGIFSISNSFYFGNGVISLAPDIQVFH